MQFPTRDITSDAVGPVIDIDPAELARLLESQDGHGLSRIMTQSKAWEPHVWKKHELSSPMRALFAAEEMGLLERVAGDRAKSVQVSDVTNCINQWLCEKERKTVSISTVLSNLRTASKWVRSAVGVCIQPDNRLQTVHFVDKYETDELIRQYMLKGKKTFQGVANCLTHAQSIGMDIQPMLDQVEQDYGLRLSLPATQHTLTSN